MAIAVIESTATNTGGGAEPPTGKQGTPKQAKAALAFLMAPVRVLMAIGRALGAISGTLAVVPYIVMIQLGAVLVASVASGNTPDAKQVERLVVLLLGAFVARLALYFIALLCTHAADVKLNRSIRERMIEAIGRAPLSWFSDRTSGLVRKTLQDDVSALHVMVAHKPVDNAVAVTMPLALLGYAFYLNWLLGLLSVSLLVVYMITFASMMRDMDQQSLELDKRFERLSGTMVEFISGINVIKAFGAVGKAHHRYCEEAKEVNDCYDAWCKPLLTRSAIVQSIVSAPMMLLTVFGGGVWLLSMGQASALEVLTVSLIALMLPSAIETLGNQVWGQQVAAAAAVRIRNLLDCERLIAPAQSRFKPNGHSVELDRVTFAYDQTVALRDVNLTLPEGSVTALVGPSGSGKSTLATLVARFHDPDEGTVRIGGVNVRDLSEEDLFNRVAFVLQRPELVLGTVAENIALARATATMNEIRAAARAAQIDADIEALPLGYATVLGRDTELSGGQAQRIAIARAILADRPILLLDEATAMTDPDCEAELQKALSNLVVGKTVLVIAHRPASVKGAHQIVVMDEGRVIAQGTHDELIDQPHYRAIWRGAGE